MHLTVEPDAFDDLGAVGFQRTAEIVKFHTRDDRDDLIGEDARDVSLERIVLPIFSPAGADFVTLVELGDDSRDVLRIVLAVAIEWNDRFTLGKIKSCHHGGRLAEIPTKVNDFDFRIFRGEIV